MSATPLKESQSLPPLPGRTVLGASVAATTCLWASLALFSRGFHVTVASVLNFPGLTDPHRWVGQGRLVLAQDTEGPRDVSRSWRASELYQVVTESTWGRGRGSLAG